MMFMPQLLMHVPVPGVPSPVMSQNSLVVPYCPQILQQAFNGQGLRVLMLVPAGGLTGLCVRDVTSIIIVQGIVDHSPVPGFWGPHTALAMGAGMGGVPELRQILASGHSLSQPAQPQVFFLLNVSSSPGDNPLFASIMPQKSPCWTV